MRLHYAEKGNRDNYISLFAFYEFPSFKWQWYSSVPTPSPAWAIGFLENFLRMFDKRILPEIREKTESYYQLISLNKLAYEAFKVNLTFPITGAMLGAWYEENRKIPMPLNVLSLTPENKPAIKKRLHNVIVV
jgi:hypothetical protein